MIKNKLKFIIFGFVFFLFFTFNNNQISASSYTVEVNSIEGLVYGSSLKSAKINGTSNVDGVFSFCNENKILDSVGNVNIEVNFTPRNLEKYDSKKINFVGFVSKRKISIVFDNLVYKQYDGTNSIELPAYKIEGIINNEVSVSGDLKGELKGIYVGEDIQLILSGLAINGNKSECYYIDFFEHKAHIYPSLLEKEGEYATKIHLPKNIYVDTRYILKVNCDNRVEKVNDKYTSSKFFSYEVYNHKNTIIDINDVIEVSMKFNDNIMSNERLAIFELTKDGEYKIIDYDYSGDILSFKISATSKVVIATRNIEYHFIVIFSSILLFSLGFIIVNRIKNSKIKVGKY